MSLFCSYRHYCILYPPTTIPPQLVCTSSRPDIVIVQDQAVKMIELTICSNSLNAMKEARRREESKQNYQSLLSELFRDQRSKK